MKFSLGGSTGNWWNTFANNFKYGGEGGKFLSSLTQGWQGFKSNKQLTNLGNKIVDATPFSDEPGGWLKGGKISDHAQNWYMDKSRKFSPLLEGGLSGTGGTLHQDLFPWMEETGMKASHHLMGTEIPGYGASGNSGSSSGSSAVVSSDTEDPSLINQGNWQAPGSIESLLRRENQMLHASTDLTKSKRGRLNVANLS